MWFYFWAAANPETKRAPFVFVKANYEELIGRLPVVGSRDQTSGSSNCGFSLVPMPTPEKSLLPCLKSARTTLLAARETTGRR